MHDSTRDRIFAACGISSVVLELIGLIIGVIGGRTMVSISSPSTDIAIAAAQPAAAGVWVGAYLELLSFGAFLAFATWATEKLGGGVLGTATRAMATSFAAVSIVSLCVLDAFEFQAGTGMDVALATALTKVNEALYVGTWFLYAFFLIGAGLLALGAARRWLGWSALVIAALTLIGTAVSIDNLGQLTYQLWLIWIIVASVALARARRDRSGVGAVVHAS